MSYLNFPANPVTGQTHVVNNIAYVWDGQVWVGGATYAKDAFDE